MHSAKSRVLCLQMMLCLLFTLLQFSAQACSVADTPLELKFGNAEKVFRGRVISVKQVTMQHPHFPITHEVTILTSEVFKGDVHLIEKVYTSESSGACGFGFNEEDKVFFVDSQAYSGMALGTFQLTPQITQDGKVISILGQDTLYALRELMYSGL